ncbi:hypothetical protein BGZ98_001228 [Dissophora globulifera]|nr:hypothetical protein BGZ98_001228 [Dissophora globulifera]
MSYTRAQQQRQPRAEESGTGAGARASTRQQTSHAPHQNGHHASKPAAGIHLGHRNNFTTASHAGTATAVGPNASGTSSSLTGPSAIARQQDSWIKARHQHQQQLLTEHFGFSPLSFVDDVINSVNNMIYQASMALQEYVESQMDQLANSNAFLDADINVKEESAKCMHKFETLLESSVDRNFDRFELYALKNLFGVPEDVDIVLPHYEALDFEIAVEREQQLDDELDYLRRRVIATKALNYKLRKELVIQENRRRQLEKCREQIRFLKDAVEEYGDVVPVPQTLIFVRDNIETLHRRFEVLHQKLQQTTTRSVLNNPASSLSASATAGSNGGEPSNTAAGRAGGSQDSVALALHETLMSVEPDQRSIYIRSVVRRQIEEFLASEGLLSSSSAPSSSSNGGSGFFAQ